MSDSATCCAPGSERYRDGTRLSSRDPSCWTVEEVMQFIREADPQLGPHADLFRKHVSVSVSMPGQEGQSRDGSMGHGAARAELWSSLCAWRAQLTAALNHTELFLLES